MISDFSQHHDYESELITTFETYWNFKKKLQKITRNGLNPEQANKFFRTLLGVFTVLAEDNLFAFSRLLYDPFHRVKVGPGPPRMEDFRLRGYLMVDAMRLLILVL